MEEKLAKQAYAEAEKEQQEKKVKEIKIIVQKTLENLEKAKESKEKIDEEIKYLKMDLDDLKNGRLDLIEERQKKDPKSKKYSIVFIEKEPLINAIGINLDYKPWTQPYYVTWNTVCDTGHCTMEYDNLPINGTLTRRNSTGTYVICNKVVNFR